MAPYGSEHEPSEGRGLQGAMITGWAFAARRSGQALPSCVPGVLAQFPTAPSHSRTHLLTMLNLPYDNLLLAL